MWSQKMWLHIFHKSVIKKIVIALIWKKCDYNFCEYIFSVFFWFFCVYLFICSLFDLLLTYDRTDNGEVQKVFYKSWQLGKITDFHVVEVVLLDVIIFYAHAIMIVHSFRYGHCAILWILCIFWFYVFARYRPLTYFDYGRLQSLLPKFQQ